MEILSGNFNLFSCAYLLLQLGLGMLMNGGFLVKLKVHFFMLKGESLFPLHKLVEYSSNKTMYINGRDLREINLYLVNSIGTTASRMTLKTLLWLIPSASIDCGS
jgi:hypothetical protein